MKTEELVRRKAEEARQAAAVLRTASTRAKDQALWCLAARLEQRVEEVVAANQQDLEQARRQGLPAFFLRRLAFGPDKIASRVEALKAIARLPDPVGQTDYCSRRPSGLEVRRIRVPLGVIGMIYEARPHVTINAGALCLKAGNAVLLKGGAEAFHTNLILGQLWQEALLEAGLPAGAVQVIPTTDREAVEVLITLSEYLDVIVPRGGQSLVRLVSERATIPVLKHYHGICHVYLDASAPLEMATRVTLDSKVLMPEVCNAAETLLVHQQASEAVLPAVAEALRQAGVTLRACPRAQEIIPWAEKATEEDWSTEYLDLVLAVKIVASLEEAIAHINRYGSHHTDAIVSTHFPSIRRFQEEVDSAVVLVNASTMFNDGGELGLGAEIGISTDRLHARGPVALEGLTTYKYVVVGDGHVLG